jgi:hypothetical protein
VRAIDTVYIKSQRESVADHLYARNRYFSPIYHTIFVINRAERRRFDVLRSIEISKIGNGITEIMKIVLFTGDCSRD